MSTDKQLTKKGESPAPYVALQADPKEIVDLIERNLGDQTVKAFDLDRVKLPSGGALIWEVPTLEGPDAAKEIEGIIIAKRDIRAYWPGNFEGGNHPPQCRSDDGKVGEGDPGGECEKCPLSAFGSADDQVQQACKQSRLLFVLRPEDILPLVIVLAPMSIQPSTSYILRLVSRLKSFDGVITRIGLEGATNTQGIKYAKATFNTVRSLTPEEIEKVKGIGQSLRTIFASQTIRRAEVDG